jgi:hypothetical protein
MKDLYVQEDMTINKDVIQLITYILIIATQLQK